jgi:single-stranded-DNA-specific exonuclease
VLGIVASRLVERYRVPALLLTVEGAVARGSGRSVPGFDLVHTLGACTELLDEWGGHKYAAGLTLAMSQLDAFRDRFVATGRPILAGLDRRPSLDIDDELPLSACDRTLALLCEKLAPFGYENPEPLFVSRGLHLLETPRRLGDRKQHLRFVAYQDGHTRECIGFGLGPLEEAINHPGRRFSAVYVPTVNRWRGRETIQLKLKDLRPE